MQSLPWLTLVINIERNKFVKYSNFDRKLPKATNATLPRLGKREPIFLLSSTCNYVVSVRRGFLFLLVLGIGLGFYCGTPWAFYMITKIVCTQFLICTYLLNFVSFSH